MTDSSVIIFQKFIPLCQFNKMEIFGCSACSNRGEMLFFLKICIQFRVWLLPARYRGLKATEALHVIAIPLYCSCSANGTISQAKEVRKKDEYLVYTKFKLPKRRILTPCLILTTITRFIVVQRGFKELKSLQA